MPSFDQVPSQIEQVVHSCMHPQESLRLKRQLELSHYPFSLPERLDRQINFSRFWCDIQGRRLIFTKRKSTQNQSLIFNSSIKYFTQSTIWSGTPEIGFDGTDKLTDF